MTGTRPDHRRMNPWPFIAFIALVLTAGYLVHGPVQANRVAAPVTPVAAGDNRVADALETANALQATVLAPTATRTPTPLPTPPPTPKATVDPAFHDCRDDQAPGTYCRKPDAPTATMTPYLSCDVAKAGEWCRMEDAP